MVSAVVTARTWVTPPVTPSASVVDMVCTESTTTRRRLHLVDVAERRLQIGFGGQVDLVVGAAGAFGPHPDLARRLLAGQIQRAPARPAAQRWATSSSSVDLPTPGSPASSVTEPGTRPPPSTRSSSLTPVWKCRVAPGSMELIGTAGEVGATARRVGRAVDRGEHRDFVDGAPGAAVRAAAHPFGGDVVAFRAAVLRTRLGHAVTVSGRQTDRTLVVTARVAGFCGVAGFAARCLARRDRHRDRGLAGLLEGEGEVVGQAVGDRLATARPSPWRRRRSRPAPAARSGRRARRPPARRWRAATVSPVSVTVPMSEVIETSLSLTSGDR